MFKKYFVFIPIFTTIIITLYLTLQKPKRTKAYKQNRVIFLILIFIGLALTLGLALTRK